MPYYKFLADGRVDLSRTHRKMSAMKTLGVPYTDDEIGLAEADAREEGKGISDDLLAQGIVVAPDSEMVALISYLQGLGKQHAPPDDTLPEAKPGAQPVAEVK
jgi:cytochrome c oxidase cbb3-type subunit I/II